MYTICAPNSQESAIALLYVQYIVVHNVPYLQDIFYRYHCIAEIEMFFDEQSEEPRWRQRQRALLCSLRLSLSFCLMILCVRVSHSWLFLFLYCICLHFLLSSFLINYNCVHFRVNAIVSLRNLSLVPALPSKRSDRRLPKLFNWVGSATTAAIVVGGSPRFPILFTVHSTVLHDWTAAVPFALESVSRSRHVNAFTFADASTARVAIALTCYNEIN